LEYVDKQFPKDNIIRIYDSPPGTSCPVIEATKDADLVLLITEPTPFGLHDLKLAVDTMKELNKNFGIVINRYGIGDDKVLSYCKDNNIPIIAKILNDRKIADLYSNGKLLYKEIPEVKKQLEKVRDYILKYQTEKNEMKEIVIVSGKGGTGKTSITASFAYLGNKDVIVADCDVDAADMHLLLKPDFGNPKDFYSGLLAKIDQEKCIKCGKCAAVCRFDAIPIINGKFIVEPLNCEGCGYCPLVCPTDAIEMNEQNVGRLFVSNIKTESKMVHASLKIGADNSGKLVAEVKK